MINTQIGGEVVSQILGNNILNNIDTNDDINSIFMNLEEENIKLMTDFIKKNEEDIINLKLRSDNSSGNIQLALSRRLGCLSTLADLSLSSNMGTLPEAVGQVIPEETKNNEIFNAIHCGSLSLDAARIIFENNTYI